MFPSARPSRPPESPPPSSTLRVTQACRDFITSLLASEPEQRLGMGPSGVAELHGHPWLRSVDVTALLAKRLQVRAALPCQCTSSYCTDCTADLTARLFHTAIVFVYSYCTLLQPTVLVLHSCTRTVSCICHTP